MESNRKRKGFVKSRLMPFSRSTPKPSSNLQYSSCKVKPSQTSPTTSSVGFVVHQDYNMVSPPKQVSFIVSADNNIRDKLSQFDKFFGIAGDYRVDIKASSYISYVQERFKLDESIQNESTKIQ